MNPYYPTYTNVNRNPYYTAQPASDEKLYVQGADGARAYLVTANGFVRLWDSTRPVFYEKYADATGRPTLMAYEYKALDMTEKPQESSTGTNVYDERLKGIEERLLKLEEGIRHEQSNADDK